MLAEKHQHILLAGRDRSNGKSTEKVLKSRIVEMLGSCIGDSIGDSLQRYLARLASAAISKCITLPTPQGGEQTYRRNRTVQLHA